MARRRFTIGTGKVGLAPGSVVFTGTQRVDAVRLYRIRYDPDTVDEGPVDDPGELRPDSAPGVLWINVEGLHDTRLVQKLGEAFGIHALALEDIVNVHQRPHVVEYDDHVYASLRMLGWPEGETVQEEHVSLVFGAGWVVSFQERPGDAFDGVRERIRSPRARIRSRGADYLWNALMDAIVDHYLLVVDELVHQVEELENGVWTAEDPSEIPERVQALRRETLVVRHAVRPLRDVFAKLVGEPPEALSEEAWPFVNDVRDHLSRLSDTLDNLRDGLSSVMDTHLSIVSMRTNQVMKVLTVIASIFIPLTFVVGIYGMNFTHMPELDMPWAYPALLAFMTAMALAMLGYFRWKKWL